MGTDAYKCMSAIIISSNPGESEGIANILNELEICKSTAITPSRFPNPDKPADSEIPSTQLIDQIYQANPNQIIVASFINVYKTGIKYDIDGASLRLIKYAVKMFPRIGIIMMIPVGYSPEKAERLIIEHFDKETTKNWALVIKTTFKPDCSVNMTYQNSKDFSKEIAEAVKIQFDANYKYAYKCAFDGIKYLYNLITQESLPPQWNAVRNKYSEIDTLSNVYATEHHYISNDFRKSFLTKGALEAICISITKMADYLSVPAQFHSPRFKISAEETKGYINGCCNAAIDSAKKAWNYGKNKES